MKVTKIKINNYRLLKDFELDLEDELSLIIGKNNCGKTSLLTILDKFIGNKKTEFTFDDFNLDFKNELKKIVEIVDEIQKPLPFLGISLKLFITYDDDDNLSNISKVMMDLDPNNKTIVLAFEYSLSENNLTNLKKDHISFKEDQIKKEKLKLENNPKYVKPENSKEKDLFYFLKENHAKYFKQLKKTIEYNIESFKENDKVYIDLIKEGVDLKNIINFKFISAKRDVSNKEPDKALSSLSSKIYKKTEANDTELKAIDDFKETLTDTDSKLDGIYSTLFSKVIEKVENFGGMKKGDSVVEIISTLQHRELLEGNTTVMYKHNEEYSLPENYNGLGYMNLISMIFEIEILLHEFKRDVTENPADINLLFIEEPEAHTHPQMQYVFIKNIKDLLKDGVIKDGIKKDLQYIISTHSSHIVAESKFDDIKYFKKEKNKVISKNLKDLEKEYIADGKPQNFKFLKQYLTLHRAELFFADKAIFIEGDTERILLPAMMKKIDQETIENPLLSQNISIVEVGAYSHIFEKFINFINLKSLIISDIDSADIDSKKIKVCDANAKITTNASLKFFHRNNNQLSYFSKLNLDWKILRRNKRKEWVSNRKGNILFIYQIEETNNKGEKYHARSFEDAFFHLNRQFIIDNKIAFNSLKWTKHFDDLTKDAYFLAEECIDKKPSFAIEVLLNSEKNKDNKEFSNWETPMYIKEGLEWLKKD